MGIFAHLFGTAKDEKKPQEDIGSCPSKIEQQCLDFIKSRVPGFTRIDDIGGDLDVRFEVFPGYGEERGVLLLENKRGQVYVKMTSQHGGKYERFIRSCLDLAKVGTIWIQFGTRASVLLDCDRIKFIDQGETFESLRIYFDLNG